MVLCLSMYKMLAAKTCFCCKHSFSICMFLGKAKRLKFKKIPNTKSA
ncbi:hypothetical protein C814_02112 [Anaerotruncus sp. G3(2012)]|nr:hypothetical protein C814_02112 [Anaerotruncus sp. G3(2012)]